ncbi:hypothetical protein VTL71DRAFT_7503, partial [Oculimacula yallundae]
MMYTDTELGQRARAITDKKARDEYISAHGTFTGILPRTKNTQDGEAMTTSGGTGEEKKEEGSSSDTKQEE